MKHKTGLEKLVEWLIVFNDHNVKREKIMRTRKWKKFYRDRVEMMGDVLDYARSLLAQEQEYLKHTSQAAVEGWKAIAKAEQKPVEEPLEELAHKHNLAAFVRIYDPKTVGFDKLIKDFPNEAKAREYLMALPDKGGEK